MRLKNILSFLGMQSLAIINSSQAATEFNTNFNTLATGAVSSAELNSASYGGTWFFNSNRGATLEIQDSQGDKALLFDDPDLSENDGNILFAGVTLSAPVDLTQKEITWNFRVATRRTGNNKGLRFTLVNAATNQPAVELDWNHMSNQVILNGGEDNGSSNFAFQYPWDADSSNVKDVSITIVGTGVMVNFDGLKLYGNVQQGATSISNFRIWTIGSSGAARGFFIDDVNLESNSLAGVPTLEHFHYRGLTANDPDHKYDLIRVYSPPAGMANIGTRPGILMFHGGGWGSGSATQFDYFCSEMAKLGYVAATADYRFSSNSAASTLDDAKELCVNDARLATAWFESNASTFGFSDGELLLGGGSAGGHLATMVALQPAELAAVARDTLKISALLLFNAAYHESETKSMNSIRVDPERQLAELVADSQLPPPAIHFFGNFDHWRTPDDFINASDQIQNGVGRALPFINACRNAGAESELWYAIGKGHSFFNAINWMERCIVEIDHFLRARLIEGETTPPSSFKHPDLQLELATSLHAWRLDWFQNEANSGNAASDQNPDSDPYSNFVEFGLGTNPLIPNQFPPLSIHPGNSKIRYTRRQQTYSFSAPAVIVELQTSTRLASDSWDTVEVAPKNITHTSPEIQSIEVAFDPNAELSRFYRLMIQANP